MYQRHSVLWIVVGIVACALVLALVTALQRRRIIHVPPKVLSASPWAVTLLAALLIGILLYDNRGIRRELREVAPAEVSELVLSRGNMISRVTDRAEISRFLTVLQTVQGAMAHHSHPTGECEAAFEFEGRRYRYRLGRDSERQDEYWVFRVGDAGTGNQELEIGRVRSAELGGLLEGLLNRTNEPPR
jgi:hypothetical protein